MLRVYYSSIVHPFTAVKCMCSVSYHWTQKQNTLYNDLAAIVWGLNQQWAVLEMHTKGFIDVGNPLTVHDYDSVSSSWFSLCFNMLRHKVNLHTYTVYSLTVQYLYLLFLMLFFYYMYMLFLKQDVYSNIHYKIVFLKT